MCRSLAPLDYLDDDAELHVTLIVCPSETSALFGVVRIKLSLQRSAFGWGQKVKLGKVLAYMCKDTDPVLQERVKELR